MNQQNQIRGQGRKPPPENTPSMILSKDENDVLFEIIGRRCTTLSTTVVQVFLTDPPDHKKWQKRYCGVVCCIKDNTKRSYFIRVYDLEKRECIWEQELYKRIEYKVPKPFFHVFEAEDCQAGLNFADENEANSFRNVIKGIQDKLWDNRSGKRSQGGVRPTQSGVTPFVSGPPERSQSVPHLPDNGKKKKNRKNHKRVTKADISYPTNFKHLQHIGWNPDSGFELKDVDEDLKEFFKVAGVSESELKDDKTRQFIYDFLNKHGGIDAALREIKAPPPLAVPPPVPSREVPQTPNNQHRHMAPPPPPSRTPLAPPPPPLPPSVLPTAPSPSPTRSGSGPPPPPPTRGPPVSRAPSVSSNRGPAPPAPPSAPSSTCAPPPPPPPPPPLLFPPAAPDNLPPPPPPPAEIVKSEFSSPSGDIPPVSDLRSSLMEAIRKGTQLNHAEINECDSLKSVSSTDSRGALLEQIRQGTILKPVPDQQKNAAPGTQLGGLAGALAKALQERSEAMNTNDSSDDTGEDDDDDDDWSD